MSNLGTRRRGRPPMGSLLLVGALILPAGHLALSLLGMVDEGSRPLREAVALAALVILGTLALAERARTQKESRRQDTYLASLIESAPLPIVLLDTDHRILTCNPAFEALFLFSRSEILGRDVDELVAGERLAQARELTERALGGEPTFTVARRSRSDGGEIDVRIFGIPLTSKDRVTGIFAVYQDITERLRSERQLKESEERFRRLSEAAFEGIFVSVDGEIVDANEQVGEMFGFSVEEMIGARIGQRVAAEHKQLVAERSRAGYDQPYRIECFRKDRSRFTVEVHSKPITFKGRRARVTAIREVPEA